MNDETKVDAVELATELTIAWLGNQNNRVATEDVSAFLRQMHATVTELFADRDRASEATDTAEQFTPAVTTRKSLSSPDHIVSMIDGKPYKSLKRHLSANGLTPDEYRERYNLKPDYPMVAPTYSEQRRAVAKKLGLGRKPRSAGASNEVSAQKPKRGGG